MDNKKIPTIVGTIIIIIIAVTVGMYLWQYEKNEEASNAYSLYQPSKIQELTQTERRNNVVSADPGKTGKQGNSIYQTSDNDLEQPDDTKSEVVACNGKKINLKYDYYNGRTEIIFKKDDSVIGSEKFDYEIEASIFKQSGCELYIGISISGRGGYILYGGPVALFKLNTDENSISKITNLNVNGQNEGEVMVNNFITDISKDGTRVIATVYNGDTDKRIVILDHNGKTLQSFSVPSKYEQFGDAKFSSNETKIAYGAAIGNIDAEGGSIYIIDVKSGKQELYKQGDGFYIIDGWKNSEEPDYKFNKK